MIDILYLAWNRLEFTRKSFETMLANTEWHKGVDRLFVYDDGSEDGTCEYLEEAVRRSPVKAKLIKTARIGPVGVMIDYICHTNIDGIFVKIDNDVMLPPGWFSDGLSVMLSDPTIDLLGIEAIRPLGPAPRSFYPDEHIGGVGFMRTRTFEGCVPAPRGRYGFTKWQNVHTKVRKGWIDPALPVCLLNLVPFEPWASLSRQYVAKGWQRDWPPPMPANFNVYWDWWNN